jgi:carbon-monoxide dehydrogenase medium subunit
MRPPAFDYFAPETLRAAIELLSTKEDARVLAGGQSLIPLMKYRLAAPKNVVSLRKVPEVQSAIMTHNSGLALNALTTIDEMATSSLIKQKFPALSVAAAEVADQQIRNRGTIGGNVAYGDPYNNLPVALSILDARVSIAGADGHREIGIADFYKDFHMTALKDDEILRSVTIEESGIKQIFLKASPKALTFPFATVAIGLKLDGRFVKEARIALGAAGPTVLRAVEAEKRLVGNELNDESISAADSSINVANPIGDIRISAEHKLYLLRTLVRRGLHSIKQGAG